MSNRGRGGRGGSRGGSSSRGGRGGFSGGAQQGRTQPATTSSLDLELEATRQRDAEDRRRTEEARLKKAEEERQKAIAEQQRRLKEVADREKEKLSEQRQLYETQIRLQRQAVIAAEEERMRRLQEAQQEIARRREQALRELEAEREARQRVEQLRVEMEQQAQSRSRQSQQQQQQALQAREATHAASSTRRANNGRQQAGDSYSQARFAPSNYNDYAILDIYNSRMEPDPSLPPVQFTKKGGYFYMGLRKCEIVESDDGPVVKTGRDSTEALQPWLERAERVEGLRAKGMQAAQMLNSVRQYQGLM